MKRIALFRFHHQFERNRHLLKFLKYLNPEMEIYGLYGGPPEKFSEAGYMLDEVLTHNFLIEDRDSTWKWKHSDMAFQLWYRDYGHQVDFDMMHSVEWDLLYFESLDKLFGHADQNTLALTGLVPLNRIEKRWYWTRHETERPEWLKLHDYFKTNFNYNKAPFGMIGPGTSLPRNFLEKIKDVEIPYLSNDELRIPMLAQVFGFKMEDTKFYRKWFSDRELKYFNSNAIGIDIRTIEKQLKKKNGRRAFHPCNMSLTYEQLVGLHNLIRENTSSRTRNTSFLSLLKNA
ncbi:MAG: hypothetical protein R6U58_13460 [Bacteroidales bacterium]